MWLSPTCRCCSPGASAPTSIKVSGTPKAVILEPLEIFAQEVMPTFKNQAKAPALADA
jgi:hypothetical protein